MMMMMMMMMMKERTTELPPNTDINCLSVTAFKTRRCNDNIELTLVPVPYYCLDHFCLKFTDQDNSSFP